MTFWSKKKVLVTGGCGHIGSRLIELLLQRNVDCIRIIDNCAAYEFPQANVFGKDILNRGNVQLMIGDISDYGLVQRAMRDIDVVFHLAAYADVGACTRNPDESQRSNIVGTRNVLNGCLEQGIQRYVFASSASIYGDQPHSKANEPAMFKEEMEPNPLSIYASAKLWAEKEARLFYEAHGLETVSLRYFSVYGPHQIPKRGSHSWVIAIFAMRAYKGKPLEIYGSGEQIRDFTYVYDIAEGTVKAAEVKSVAGEAVNIGTGRPTSIKELAVMVKDLAWKYFGREPEIGFGPKPSGDPLGGYASTIKMRQLLKWEPRMRLEEGLRRYFDWVLSHTYLIPEYV